MRWYHYLAYFFGGAFLMKAALGALLMGVILARALGKLQGGLGATLEWNPL